MNAGRENEKTLFIGQLADRAEVSTDTVRYYEPVGLMHRPGRSASGYRVYQPADVERLHFIQKAQGLGFSLEQIKTILELRGSGRVPCRQVIQLAEDRLAAIEKELTALRTLQKAIQTNLRRWKNQVNENNCASSQFCNLIEELKLPNTASRNSRNPPSSSQDAYGGSFIEQVAELGTISTKGRPERRDCESESNQPQNRSRATPDHPRARRPESPDISEESPGHHA